jgi:sugar phosphate permease
MDINRSDNTGSKKPWGYRHVIVFTVWLLYVINYFDRLSVLTFLPLIRQDLHLTHQQVGFAASIFFFAYAGATMSAGILADKFGPRKIMAIAIVAFTCVTFVTGRVQNFTQLVMIRLGLGLGEGHHFAPACRTIADWVPKNEKGRAMGFMSSSWQFAPIIVPPLVTYLAAVLGSWRTVFYLLAIPGVFGIIILFAFVTNKPEEMLKRGRLSQKEYDYIEAGLVSEETTGTKANMKWVMKDPSLWLWAMQQFFILAVSWGILSWLSSFLYEQHGLNIKKMGMLYALPYVLAFISTNLGGMLMDKVFHRTRPVALISFLSSIPIFMYIGHVPKGHTYTLIAMLLLTGFFWNLVWGVVNAYPQVRYPKEVLGKVVGLTICIGMLGSLTSPMIAGYLVRTTATGVSYDHVFLLFASFAAMGALVTCFIKEGTYTAKPPEAKKAASMVA